jgi:hypothetical protein
MKNLLVSIFGGILGFFVCVAVCHIDMKACCFKGCCCESACKNKCCDEKGCCEKEKCPK